MITKANQKKIIVTILFFSFFSFLNAEYFEGLFARNLRTVLKNVPKESLIGIGYIKVNDYNTALNIYDDLELTITELGYNVVNRFWWEYKGYFEENYDINFILNQETNHQNVIKIGKLIRTDYMINGIVVERGNNRSFVLSLIDINTEKIIETITCEM